MTHTEVCDIIEENNFADDSGLALIMSLTPEEKRELLALWKEHKYMEVNYGKKP